MLNTLITIINILANWNKYLKYCFKFSLYPPFLNLLSSNNNCSNLQRKRKNYKRHSKFNATNKIEPQISVIYDNKNTKGK